MDIKCLPVLLDEVANILKARAILEDLDITAVSPLSPYTRGIYYAEYPRGPGDGKDEKRKRAGYRKGTVRVEHSEDQDFHKSMLTDIERSPIPDSFD